MAIRGSKLEGQIPKLYRRSALNLLMYGFVTGVRATLHTVNVKQAIFMFMEAYAIDDDDFNVDSAMVIYNRMQKEFLNM